MCFMMEFPDLCQHGFVDFPSGLWLGCSKALRTSRNKLELVDIGQQKKNKYRKENYSNDAPYAYKYGFHKNEPEEQTAGTVVKCPTGAMI